MADAVNSGPIHQKGRLMQLLLDCKDALVFRIRSRKLTERQRRKIHEDTVDDPEVQQALERTLAAHPQFRRKASKGGGVPDHRR